MLRFAAARDQLWLFLNSVRNAWPSVVLGSLVFYLFSSQSIFFDQLEQFVVSYGQAVIKFIELRKFEYRSIFDMSIEGIVPLTLSFVGVCLISRQALISTQMLAGRRSKVLQLIIFLMPVAGWTICISNISYNYLDQKYLVFLLQAMLALFLTAEIFYVAICIADDSSDTPQLRRIALEFIGSVVVYMLLCVLVGSPHRSSLWFSSPIDHTAVAGAPGAIFIVLVAISAFFYAISSIIYIGRATKLPLFIPALVTVGAMVAYAPDSHPVRREYLGRWQQQVDLVEGLSNWLQLRRPASNNGSADPIIIVSAEGGGIRAAYFTAMTLARIADECPYAARQIFAISGVSGGSVGAAIYAAAIHRHPIQPFDHRCNLSSVKPSLGPIGTAVEKILSGDHLTPLLARAVTSDALSLISPIYLPSFDRQLGLEFSIENASERVFNDPLMSRPFGEFIPTKANPSVPYLMFNSTSVEGSLHFVASFLRWGDHYPYIPDGIHFLDYSWRLPELSLVTAAAMSARFPYVSPAGFIDNSQIGRRHFVDGGYYDNTGLVTALSLARSIKSNYGAPVFILHIGNSQECNEEVTQETSGCRSVFLQKPQGSLAQSLLSPAQVLLGVRTEQSLTLRRQLEQYIDSTNSEPSRDSKSRPSAAVGMQITQDLGSEPLGWFLSGAALNKLRRAVYADQVSGLRCTRGSRSDDGNGALQAIGYSPSLRAAEPIIEKEFHGEKNGNVVPFANQCAFYLIQEYMTREALLDDPFRRGYLPDPHMPAGRIACLFKLHERWLKYPTEEGNEAMCF